MQSVPKYYWIASGLALLWAIAGCAAYLSQVGMSPEDLAKLPQGQRDIWLAMPGWVIAAYAVAVWSALGGTLGLLLRRRWARLLLLISLIGIIVQFGWTFLATPVLQTEGTMSAAFPLFILLAGISMLMLARIADNNGWLR